MRGGLAAEKGGGARIVLQGDDIAVGNQEVLQLFLYLGETGISIF